MEPNGQPGETTGFRGGRVRFGEIEFDPRTLELWRDGQPVRVALLPARLLALLVERPGELLTRDAIKQALWGETFVQYDASLNFCVNQLRSALGDDAEHPRYVETLRGRGYRLVAPGRAPAGAAPAPARRTRALASRRAALAGLLVVGLGGGAIGVTVGAGLSSRAPRATRPRAMAGPEALRREAQRHGTRDVLAFQDYVRGRRHYKRYRREDNESAIVFYTRALERDPDFNAARAELANALAQRNNLRGPSREWAEAAERTAREAVERQPALPEAHKALGVAYAVQGRLDDALACYQKAIELRPDYGEAVFNAGVVEHTRGHWVAALEWQRRFAELFPGAPDGWVVALTLWDLGFEEPAHRWVQAVLAREPTHFEAQALRVGWALRARRLDEAGGLARQLLSLYPDDPRAWLAYGTSQRLAGQLEDAVRSFENALSRAGRASRYARLRRAEALWAAGHRRTARLESEAIRWTCRDSVDAGRDDGWCPWSLAVLSAAEGRREDAIRRLATAADLGRRDWRWDVVEPAFQGLRGDPAFDAIVERMRDDVEAMRRQVAARPLPLPPFVAGGASPPRPGLPGPPVGGDSGAR